MYIDVNKKPDDDELLDFSVMLKKTLIDDMIKEGLPKDMEVRGQLLHISDSLDRTLLSKKKLKIDEADSQNNADLNRLLTDVILNHKARVTKSQRLEREIELPEEASDIEVVDGETDIGITFLTSTPL